LIGVTQPAAIDAVMRALADPTRRSVFERIVGSDEISVAELTRGSGVTQGAISQHLKSLKQAGLVAERAQGRNVFYRAAPEGLSPLADWLKSYHRFWTDRLDTLEKLLRDEDARKPNPKGAEQ
jgi:DNA-binding transcriptional ArsR family regulator